MKKLAAIGAVAVVVAVSLVSAQAASARPAGITPAEYRALMIHSEGLNNRFAHKTVSPVPVGMTRDEYRALLLRSEGLNRKYSVNSLDSLTLERGTQQRFGIGNPLREGPVANPTVSDSSNIAWDNIGIGMGAALGLLALIATAVIGVRHHGQHGHLGTS
jgi:hypothetical protein